MGCGRQLFTEAGPSRPRSGGTPSPAGQQVHEVAGALVRETSAEHRRIHQGSEPSDTGEGSGKDASLNDSEVLEHFNDGFRTPRQPAGNLDGSSELPAETTGGEGVVFSPAATLSESQMNEEEELPPQTHKASMHPDLIPREGMSFRSDEEAKEFYQTYAELAGFGVKMSNRKTHSRVMRCTNTGVGKYYKGNEDLRVRNKTTKKTGCNAHLKFTRLYDNEGNEGNMVLVKANLFHNHLLLTPWKTEQMRSHKSKDPAIFEIIDELQEAGVTTQQIKNVLQNMHGGHAELVPVTAQDIANRKAANVRAEHADDIKGTCSGCSSALYKHLARKEKCST